MFYEQTDLVFPPRAIPALKDLRGPAWQALVQKVLQTPDESPERLAFMLMMARLTHCDTCNLDTYRATRGCERCAVLAVKRFRGEDQTLLARYEQAMHDILQFLRGETHE